MTSRRGVVPALLLLLSSCAVAPQILEEDNDSPLAAAEKKAGPAGRKILETGRDMALVKKEILPGACWDWINTAYNRAGYPSNKRKTVYKTKKKGPYADLALIQPGDWLYYVNHSYGGIEHSGIFVDWVNKGSKLGLILSYPGEKRREPGRYLPYDLSSVYTITRPASP